MRAIVAIILRFVSWIDSRMTVLSIRLIRLTGKSSQFLHPKHLASIQHHDWYLDHIQPTDRVLDIGCGTGTSTRKVAECGKQATGFDYSQYNLNIANSICRENDLDNVNLISANAENKLPFHNGSFDKVLFLDVIEHLYKRVNVLHEIGRILKPEGKLLLSAPNVDSSWKRVLKWSGLPYYADADHKIEYTFSELEEELARGGFQIVEPPQTTVLETPLAGLIDITGGISLKLYKKLQQWKIHAAIQKPNEATGWRVICCRQEFVGGKEIGNSQKNDRSSS